LIDENGEQLGIFGLREALRKAYGKGLDLIQVTEKVDPPVCKIIDYGKYAYQMKKREKQQATKKGGELKNIRLSFNISEHDMENRAKTAKKFLEKGDKVRIDMVLRGRQKALSDFAREKMNKFLEGLNALSPFKVERELKRQGRGLTIIITKI